jgi:hypothetical protein
VIAAPGVGLLLDTELPDELAVIGVCADDHVLAV